jgi:hypothetical protein
LDRNIDIAMFYRLDALLPNCLEVLIDLTSEVLYICIGKLDNFDKFIEAVQHVAEFHDLSI